LRIGLAGGGTDVSPYCDTYGGLVLNATISIYAYTHINSAPKGKVIFRSIDKGFENTYDAAHIPVADVNLPLHSAVYQRIIRQFNSGNPLFINLCTYSEAPAGSGLGSSSALVVSMIRAFTKYLNISMNEMQLAALAYQIEREDLRMHGGMQDHYAAAFGGINCIEFNGVNAAIVNPLKINDSIIAELEASLLLFFTGISRDSSLIIDDQIKNITSGQLTSIEAMHSLKADVMLMKENLLNGNIAEMGRILDSSWHKKKCLSDRISNKLIDEVYDSAIKLGAYGGKISGAGGGGFFMFLVDPKLRFLLSKELISKNGAGTIHTVHFSKSGSTAWSY
jgi:D-glycero-alpha-D-manno-heptose-7-phosphate kinase